MEKVGFIGLGVMGLPMSKRLINAGYDLHVYDVEKKPLEALKNLGAHQENSPKDVASAADVIISMLPKPSITFDVALGEDGIIHGIKPSAVYIDMSTSKPFTTREIAGRLAEKGVEMLDAPVSGGEKGAIEGSLTIMVGGAQDIFDRVLPLLQHLGKNVMHVGGIGAGHTIKVINNMLFTVNMAATSEALALGKKAGVDPVMLRNVMNTSSGRSYALDIKVRDFVIPRNFEPGFTVELQNKDTDLALDLAKSLGVPVILGSLVRQLYQSLVVKGYAKKDTSIIATFFEDLLLCNEDSD